MQSSITLVATLLFPMGKDALAAAFHPITRSLQRVGLAFLLVLGLLNLPARAQSFSWANKITGKANGSAVTADKQGMSYVLTAFSGSTTIYGKTFTSIGGTDLLLVQYYWGGTIGWATRIGSAGDDLPGDVIVSADGSHVHLMATIRGTATLESADGSPKVQVTGAGGSDMLVAKYTFGGKHVWSRRAGSTGDDFGNGIDLDNAGNVYLTGAFTGTMQFYTPLTSISITSLGSSDVFIAKYTKDGFFQLAGKTGGKGYDFGKAIAVNKSTGDIYVTGGYSPATNLYTTNILLAKFYPQGHIQWAKSIGTANHVDQGNDLIATSQGVYVTGYFASTTAFDAVSVTSNGPADAFLAFYNYATGGPATWVKRFGGSGWDEGQSLAPHGSGMFMGGTFTGSATFGATTLMAKGGVSDRELFVSSLSLAGAPAWSKPLGTTSADYGNGGVAATSKNTVFFTGSYGGALLMTPFYLTGPGTMLTRIDLPTVSNVALINALTDYSVKSLFSDDDINYRNLQTNKINFEVKSEYNSFASVKLKLDGVVKVENAAPYTWTDATPKNQYAYDYKGVTLAEGTHVLEVTPYAGSDATGLKGDTKVIQFTVTNPPKLTGFSLIDAGTDKVIKFIKPSETLYLYFTEIDGKKFNVQAEYDSVKVGSVRFRLNGSERMDNTAPFTCAGDAPQAGGGTDYQGITLVPGSLLVEAMAHSQPDGAGSWSDYIKATITISSPQYRIASALNDPETQPATFLVAPNPFQGRTFLSLAVTQSGPATVEIYNAQGVRVARLHEGDLEAGKAYQWEFDGGGLPNGMYIGRIRLGGQVLHQRLVLNR